MKRVSQLVKHWLLKHGDLAQSKQPETSPRDTKKRSDYRVEILGYKCIVFIENMIRKLLGKSEDNN